MSAVGRERSRYRLLEELTEPVALLGAAPLGVERLGVLLARAEPRAWRIESTGSPIAGCCPLGSGRTLIACARPPLAPVLAGGYLVGRSLPVGPGRWVVLGRAAVVAPADAARFERLLASLRAPRGEFWRVHGVVLTHAARSAA